VTTASGGSEFRYQTAINRIAHVMPWLWWLSAAMTPIRPIFEDVVPVLLLDIAFVLLLVFGILWASPKHAQELCEKCAATTPNDPEQAVEKDGWWLRVLHWNSEHLGLTVMLLGVAIGVEWTTDGPLSAGLHIMVDVYFGIIVMAQLKHRVLSPWCPWCRWGGGGDDDVVPEPAPPPSVHADR
jgi:hypothetical protein